MYDPITTEELWSLKIGDVVQIVDDYPEYDDDPLTGEVLHPTDGKWLHVRFTVPHGDARSLDGAQDLVTAQEIVAVLSRSDKPQHAFNRGDALMDIDTGKTGILETIEWDEDTEEYLYYPDFCAENETYLEVALKAI
jgi:hypothetical protein